MSAQIIPFPTRKSSTDALVGLIREACELGRTGRKHPNWQAHVEEVLEPAYAARMRGYAQMIRECREEENAGRDD